MSYIENVVTFASCLVFAILCTGYVITSILTGKLPAEPYRSGMRFADHTWKFTAALAILLLLAISFGKGLVKMWPELLSTR